MAAIKRCDGCGKETNAAYPPTFGHAWLTISIEGAHVADACTWQCVETLGAASGRTSRQPTGDSGILDR